MKTNQIRIIIDAPAQSVFEFTVEPQNTPKWIDGVDDEQVNTDQIDLGTIYSNSYGDLEVTDYERNKFFELTNQETGYVCSYSYRAVDEEQTELTYFEYMTDGSELDEPMDEKNFETLQALLTNK